jgi:hypothetical protein
MTPVKVTLDCGICAACPCVEFREGLVLIGEEGNLVRLTPAQWNDLVRKVRGGALAELKAAVDPSAPSA